MLSPLVPRQLIQGRRGEKAEGPRLFVWALLSSSQSHSNLDVASAGCRCKLTFLRFRRPRWAPGEPCRTPPLLNFQRTRRASAFPDKHMYCMRSAKKED
jgi:hypothetical protein